MFIRVIFLVAGLGLLNFESSAQPGRVLPLLQEEKQNVVEAISLYPDAQRVFILQASAYPEVLVRINHIRGNTESRFKTLISGLTETDQKRIYNLSRFPELIAAVCDGGSIKSGAEMNTLLALWPDEVHVDAIHVNNQHFNLLQDVQKLYAYTDLEFKSLLSKYPEPVREAYIEVSNLPEVMSLLSENLDVAVLLGDAYKHNPVQLNAELDSLSVKIAEAQTKELNAWKKELEENPEALKEYEASSKEFADEYGYDDDVYLEDVPENVPTDVYIHHVWRPYSYWFGWPSWYDFESWYPYPSWYHRGYYYDPHHVIVIIGWPSAVFMHWHFNHHRHFYQYPHFTNHVVKHFYGPRRIGSRIQPVYRNWEQKHRKELPNNWFDNDKARVDRIREYGKFKMDYEEKIRINREKSPTEREYLRDNADRYPGLKPVLREKPEPVRTQPSPGRQYQPTKRDKTPSYQPADKTDAQPKPRQQTEPERVKREQPEKQPSPSAAPSKKESKKATPRKEPTKRE